jgi:hypothetical protein
VDDFPIARKQTTKLKKINLEKKAGSERKKINKIKGLCEIYNIW